MASPDTKSDTKTRKPKAVSGPIVFTTNESFGVLTDDVIARARCSDTVDRVVLRCRRRGLELHLYRSGKPARWYARPTLSGRQYRLNLGTLESLPSVAEAHAAMTQELLKADRHGTEALEDRATFGGLISDYLEALKIERRGNTYEAYSRPLLRYAMPRLGQHKLRHIRRIDLVTCIEDAFADMRSRGLKGKEANHLCTAIQGAWRWGLKKGRVEADIVAVLPMPALEEPRQVVLTDEQLRIVWDNTAPGADAPLSNLMRSAIRVTLVTAQRIGAVLLTLSTDLDLEAGTWTIRAQDGTKLRTNSAPHIVPLPPLAQHVWREALKISEPHPGAPVFPADRLRSRSLTMRQDSAGTAMAKLRAEHQELGDVTLHDMRRTARTRISGACHRESAERWLGHTIGSKTERTYDTDQHLDEKREAALAWEAYLARIKITC